VSQKDVKARLRGDACDVTLCYAPFRERYVQKSQADLVFGHYAIELSESFR
jgi:hypothetical protein